MSEQDTTVQAPTPEIVETTTNDTSEKKLGELLQSEAVDEKPTVEEPKQSDSVALGKFLAEKKARKALEKKVKELEEAINGEVSDDDDDDSTESTDIAEKYGVDKKFLKELTKSVEKNVEAKFQPILKEKEEARIDKVFNQHFGETMEAMPEYKGVVNPDVIKSLSLDPKNANLTFRELIEKTYGNALGGKRTIESTVHNGGKEPQNVDYERAQQDSEYFKEVMSDPTSKKKYNEEMLRRLAGTF